MPIVALEKLGAYSAFDRMIWSGQGDDPITREEVASAIAEGRFQKMPLDTEGTRRDHVERIAYLVVHPARTPLELDVGIPHLGCHVDWPLLDGHHRLAAAIYRGDATIDIDAAGSIDYAEELFGVPFPRNVRDRILETLRRYPGSTSTEIAKYLDNDGVLRSSVSTRLTELVRLGQVEARGERPRRYHVKA